MPVYEFQCNTCGKIKEEITIFKKAQEGIKCSRCGDLMVMIMSAANFHTDETRARRILSKGRSAKGTARKK